jgi:hypothetical protein
MKPDKNTKKNKNQALNKFLKKKKVKKNKKLLSFAEINLDNIDKLLDTYRPDDAEGLKESIRKFLNTVMRGDACNLTLPAHMGPGLTSLLLNNMSYWLGNTQETLKTSHAIENLS